MPLLAFLAVDFERFSPLFLFYAERSNNPNAGKQISSWTNQGA